MNKELPFELPKYHKKSKKAMWKHRGILFTEEGFDYWYEKYIYATNCDLCNIKFKSSKERHLDHNHGNGIIRNVVCTKCNRNKYDSKIQSNNTTGYKYIHKRKDINCKQGFIYCFTIQNDYKTKYIKQSVNLENLIKFRDQWLKENNYNT
jgi:hypothetical protein